MAPSPRRRRHLPLLLPLLLVVVTLRGAAPAAGTAKSCKAWLMQSITTDMPHLRRLLGVLSTGLPKEGGHVDFQAGVKKMVQLAAALADQSIPRGRFLLERGAVFVSIP
ncbi:phospholipase D Z-like [Hordeum vulgare]|nr:phospholipase D Z-like [Hordeum vulgare]